MNELGKKLFEQTKQAEKNSRIHLDPYALRFHLMPTTGWLNDPNGLCEKDGVYHIFYQYSPLDVEGGMKAWGHYTTRDFLQYERKDAPLFPDTKFDKDGVYSGSAFVEDGTMYLYYTGNVKQDGDFDYCYKGREANTILVESQDGEIFGAKEVVMTNDDYPEHYSCHIRDPKVWKENGKYYMVQGGRTMEDKGTVLIFESDDLFNWEYKKDITSQGTYGYMWECPDTFNVSGKNLLSCSPQGLDAEEYRFQNEYQSGYFVLKNTLVDTDEIDTDTFVEWDMGFDFYAPQTFLDEKGRRIIIGWAGVGDAIYDNAPTVAMGWQHALTLPREISVKEDKVSQYPIKEIEALREKKSELTEGTKIDLGALLSSEVFELQFDRNGMQTMDQKKEECEVVLGSGEEAVAFRYSNGVLTLGITKEAGRGRDVRTCRIDDVDSISLFVDTSMIEIYVNHGEKVFTTRYYFENNNRTLEFRGFPKAIGYGLRSFEILG